MTGQAQVPVPTTTRATQHIRLPQLHDAYEHLCVLTLLSSLGPLRKAAIDESFTDIELASKLQIFSESLQE